MVVITLKFVVADAIVVGSSHYTYFMLYEKLYPKKKVVYPAALEIYCSGCCIFGIEPSFETWVYEAFMFMVDSSVADPASSCLCFERNLGGSLGVDNLQAEECLKRLFRNHQRILANSFLPSFQRLELQLALLGSDPWLVILLHLLDPRLWLSNKFHR